MLDSAISKTVLAQSKNIEFETITFLDADRGIYSYKAPFSLLRDRLPINCRYVPDYGELRKWGLYIGLGIAGLALFFSIVVGVKMSVTAGVYLGGLSVLSAVVLAVLGWQYGPNLPFHDYRPFWLVRLVTRNHDEDPPYGHVGVSTVNCPDGAVRYMVPYTHSFLNLRSLTEEQQNEEYTPFVVRATTLYRDSQMTDERKIVGSTGGNKWDKIKAGSLITLIFAELVAVFLLTAMVM